MIPFLALFGIAMQEPIEHHPPRCPHPYLGVESLSGAKEIWWFNGYDSPEEPSQVADAYTRNKAFMAALTRNQRRKARLTEKVVETSAR